MYVSTHACVAEVKVMVFLLGAICHWLGWAVWIVSVYLCLPSTRVASAHTHHHSEFLGTNQDPQVCTVGKLLID